MSHAFISYVRKDTPTVDRLCNDLGRRGIQFWIDRRDISPGKRWKKAIRTAIQDGDFFLACFSQAYFERSSTYMNEELALAIETLRQRSEDSSWFIPVLLEECEVPDRMIGGGETLRDIQFVPLYEDWDRGIESILRVLKPHGPDPEPSGTPEVVPVLYVVVNPEAVVSLQLDTELRAIQEQLLLSQERKRFDVRCLVATSAEDLSRALIESRPRIVHLAGRATVDGELLLGGTIGTPLPLTPHVLGNLFSLSKHGVECIVLNICRSNAYAEELSRSTPFVIGIAGDLTNEEAIDFAASFFQAVGDRLSIPEAFRVAKSAAHLSRGRSTGHTLWQRTSYFIADPGQPRGSAER